MGLKNVLNKMGLVEDDIPVKAPQSKNAAPEHPVFTKAEVSAPTIEVDPTVKDMLEQSLQDNKLAGFDYLKFISAVEEMKVTGTSEDTRFKTVFITAKQLGASKDNLLKSGEHYLEVLSQDESDFNSDCEQYSKKEVKAREAEITKIEATIKSLNEQLASLQSDHESLSRELEDEKSKLESRKTSFQTTLQSFKDTIQNNIDKINQYL